MILRLLIVADDLTGALDSAVGHAGKGRKVIVARSPAAIPQALAQSPDVLAVNTSSREIAPDEAACRVTAALEYLNPATIPVVLKKVDSRLKGNIAAETKALTEWFAPDHRIACPAIPGMGRCVIRGALQGSGVDVPIPVAGCFQGMTEVPDVTSDADLDRLVQTAQGRTLWVGARGIAFALARADGIPAPEMTDFQPPVMIANGSRDPVTRAQIAALARHGTILAAPDGVAPDGDLPRGPLILSISDGGTGISGREAAARFARTTTRLARRFQPHALLICGGESAQAVLDQFGVNSLQVTAELRPGLPLCDIETGWGKVQIVTKSGGFGAPDLLADILEEATNRR